MSQKLFEISKYSLLIKEKTAILGLSETILDANKSDNRHLQFENYILHSKFRKKKGGVCCYLYQEGHSQEAFNQSRIQCIQCLMNQNRYRSLNQIYLHYIYWPPKDPRYQQFLTTYGSNPYFQISKFADSVLNSEKVFENVIT